MQIPFKYAALSVLTVGLAVTLPTLPALAQTRLSEPAGGFSYLPPAGWHIKTLPGLKYKISYAMPANGFAPNINVVDEVSAMPLDKYLQFSMVGMRKAYTSLHVLKQAPFVTASGVHGERLAVDGVVGDKHMHQVFYVFPANNRKIVVTASSLASDGGKYDAATDKSIKTFKLQ